MARIPGGAGSRRSPRDCQRTVRWLVRLDVEIGILALVSSAAVFIRSGWFSAGEQVAVVIGVLVALWITAIALVMLEGAEVAVPG